METLNYLLALIISFSGIFVGMLLGYIAKEELKPGKKYFIWIQNIILIFAAIFVLYSFHLNIILSIIIGLVMTLGILYFKPKAVIGYILLAVLIFISLGNTNLFIITSSLTFLYGFPTGSLILTKK